tara:strand:+ start:597 stop:1355 length:759 start_codon:yes stop_codon:yes gene_type:complete
MEIEIIYLITFLIVMLQTIVGVGVLVLGTPIFLLLNYNIIEIMNLLLPVSIVTSFINYIYLKFNKRKLKIKLDKEIKKNIILLFIPGILFGLFLTSKLINLINFQILVSIVIFSSLFIKLKFEDRINSLSLNYKKIILIMISVIHGLSNSGGTLLTIFFSAFNKDKKNQSRYSITFYYLIFASVQYFIFLFIFKDRISFLYSYKIIFIIMLSIFFGTYIVNHISLNFFKKMIELLALFSAFFLLLNNFITIN